MQMTYMELRYFKAYCQFKAGHRLTRPAPSSYRVDPLVRAERIRRFADSMFNHYYDRRRESRRARRATACRSQ